MKDSRTPVQIHIDRYEHESLLLFKPSIRFYEQIGITSDSFWRIVKGKRKPYVDEIKALSKHFKIPIQDFFK